MRLTILYDNCCLILRSDFLFKMPLFSTYSMNSIVYHLMRKNKLAVLFISTQFRSFYTWIVWFFCWKLLNYVCWAKRHGMNFKHCGTCEKKHTDTILPNIILFVVLSLVVRAVYTVRNYANENFHVYAC